MNKNLLIAIIGITAVVVGLGVWFYMKKQATPSASPSPVACTLEAKLCPDGSFVSRVGPSCEFAPCPGTKTPTPTPRYNY